MDGASSASLDRTFPRYGDSSTVSDNPAELEAYNQHLEAVGQPPESVAALQIWVQSGQIGDE
jgi:hypothetical protein